jgi:hypothetical protein
VQGILEKEIAQVTAAVIAVTPRERVLGTPSLRSETGHEVSIRPKVVVHDIEHHGHVSTVSLVDKHSKLVRCAVTSGRSKERHAVVPATTLARLPATPAG